MVSQNVTPYLLLLSPNSLHVASSSQLINTHTCWRKGPQCLHQTLADALPGEGNALIWTPRCVPSQARGAFPSVLEGHTNSPLLVTEKPATPRTCKPSRLTKPYMISSTAPHYSCPNDEPLGISSSSQWPFSPPAAVGTETMTPHLCFRICTRHSNRRRSASGPANLKL